MELLQAYHFNILYKPEKTNVVTDALSCQASLATIRLQPDENWMIRMTTGYLVDPDKDKYPLQPSGLRNHEQKIYVPDYDSLRQEILHEHHDSLTTGHFGQARTLDLVKQHFFWPTLTKDVNNYVASCEEC